MRDYGKALAFAPAVCFSLGLLGLPRPRAGRGRATFGGVGDSLVGNRALLVAVNRLAQGAL